MSNGYWLIWKWNSIGQNWSVKYWDTDLIPSTVHVSYGIALRGFLQKVTDLQHWHADCLLFLITKDIPGVNKKQLSLSFCGVKQWIIFSQSFWILYNYFKNTSFFVCNFCPGDKFVRPTQFSRMHTQVRCKEKRTKKLNEFHLHLMSAQISQRSPHLCRSCNKACLIF